jgi:flagellar biogenesis protein FliO
MDVKDLVERAGQYDLDRRGVLMFVALVGVLALLFVLIFVLPRLIGGVVG